MINSISPIAYVPSPQITAQDINNMYGPHVYQENLNKIYSAENELKQLKEPVAGYHHIYNKYGKNNVFQEISQNKFFKYNQSELIEIIRNIEIDKYEAEIKYTKATPGYYNHMVDAIAHINVTGALMRLNKVLNNPKLDMETKEYIILQAKNAAFCKHQLEELDNINEDDIKAIKATIYPDRDRLPYNT